MFDWNGCQQIAKTMSIANLEFAIRDCQKTIRVIENDGNQMPTGKYYDQISVYRSELEKRRK